MGTQQSYGIYRFNRQQKSERKRLHELDLSTTKGGYSELEDHRQMNLLAFAEFQKEQFAQKRLERKKIIRVWIVVSILTILIIVTFLLLRKPIIEQLFSPSYW
ncbi:hypothetical protein POV27_06160 [Aureisphaera galaxeae]|uniref:hypothetical protein n=1 Tax=Aureisphaera galaxeae TaxID=1538023 RepID=UPI002350DCEF|nr:hypothetical protein [Aureisphaera galaxeae]MDC8003627.1 hypothetical protein [Aureisphaera galaxeae]